VILVRLINVISTFALEKAILSFFQGKCATHARRDIERETEFLRRDRRRAGRREAVKFVNGPHGSKKTALHESSMT
jgi:hypothetical protein